MKFILLSTRLFLPNDSHLINVRFCSGGRGIACPTFPQNTVTQLPAFGAGCITLCVFGMQGGLSDWCPFLFERMIQSITFFHASLFLESTQRKQQQFVGKIVLPTHFLIANFLLEPSQKIWKRWEDSAVFQETSKTCSVTCIFRAPSASNWFQEDWPILLFWLLEASPVRIFTRR